LGSLLFLVLCFFDFFDFFEEEEEIMDGGDDETVPCEVASRREKTIYTFQHVAGN